MIGVIVQVLKASVLLLIPAVGELFNQRAGSLNIGIDGMMLVGALGTVVVAEATGNVWIALLGGMAVAGILGLVNGFMAVSMRVDQVASGLGIWILALGATTYFGTEYYGPTAAQLPLIDLGGRVEITPMMFIAFILVLIVWYVLEKTQFGLKVRSAGEDPRVAEVWGANVRKIRYIGMIVAGVTAGLGGAYLVTHYNPIWVFRVTSGRGFIALALVFFSLHKVKYIAGSSIFFGATWVLSAKAQAWVPWMNIQILNAIPYIATVVVLFVVRFRYKSGGEPASLGKPYFKE